MALKGILFDLDNTQIDFMSMKKACSRAAVQAMADHGLKMDAEDAYQLLFSLFQEHGIENKEIFQLFLERAAGEINPLVLAHGIVAYRDTQRAYRKPYARVAETLLWLREHGLKLAIVSDAPTLKACLRMVEVGLDPFYHAVVGYDDTKHFKPHPVPFQKGLEALNIQPEEALMVGDRPDRDIKGAKALGIKTCYAQYGNANESCEDADFVIQEFEDLKKVVLGLL